MYDAHFIGAPYPNHNNLLMNVNCHFCNKLCRKHDAKYPVMTRHIWQCDYHGAVRVWHTFIGDIKSVTLVVIHKEQNYHATFVFNVDKPSFYINHPTKQNPVNVIFNLDFHPDITPENIADKLPTYLTFA